MKHAFDGAADILNVQPIVSEFVRRQIREGCDMSAPKHDRGVPGRDGMTFETPRNAPAFRSLRFMNGAVLRDGQTTQFTNASDAMTGEVVRIDVTLTVVK